MKTKMIETLGLKTTDTGVVTAAVSVYGVKDKDGDRTSRASFEDFAASVNKGETQLPVVWQHQINDPDLYIGDTLRLDLDGMTAKGAPALVAKMQLDLDHPKAERAFKLLKSGRVKQWSYRWDGTATRAKDGATDLSAMTLGEISPVLAGANDQTRTLSAKAADPDAGTNFEALSDWLSENLDPDTLDTLGALMTPDGSPEERAKLVVMLGSYADCLEMDLTEPMMGMMSRLLGEKGTSRTQASPAMSALAARARLLEAL